jgi:TonB-linked SusC/RagA family outer membrane protein
MKKKSQGEAYAPRLLSANFKHVFKLMRFALLYLLLGVSIAFATEADSQTARVNIRVNDAQTKEVIGLIEKQTEYLFVYDYDRVDLSRKVTMHLSQAPVAEALARMFEHTDVVYAVEGNNILLMKRNESQEKKQNVYVVDGIVVDAKGEPVVGANVVEKGTTNGVVTDVDGKFALRLSSQPPVALLITYIGYLTQEVEATGHAPLRIVLREDAQSIEEVVVVGYGTQRRSDVTGAISSIGERMLKEVPSMNVSQSMQGRVAGVSIQQTATSPGADSQIRIRGTRSLTASNDPLIVVDGIPFAGKLNDVPSDDVRSIDILKDASSTAIYGSRGANGVILITTDRADMYTKPQIAYNGYYGIATVAKRYEMFGAEDFIRLRTLSGYQEGSPFLPQEQEYFATGKTYDWQDEMYKTANVNSHDLSFRAGSEAVQGSVGLNYYNETSVLPGQDFSRYSQRGTMDIKVGRRLKVGLNTQNSFHIVNGEGVGTAALYEMLAFSPLANPYDANGKPLVQPLLPREDAYSPLLLKDKSLWAQERKRFVTRNSLYGEVQFTPELKYRLNLGLNYYHDQYGQFYSSDSPFKDGGTSSASITSATGYNYAVENLLYYDKTFADRHRAGAALMYSVEDDYYEYITAEGLNMTADYMKYHNLGMANDGVTFNGNEQSYRRRTLLSYMGRLNYAFDGKYMATLTLRSDGSSVLAPGRKWHTYPALSLAWNLNRESFLKNAGALDMLKIRLGYGQTSNQSVNPYATLGSLGQSKYNFGSDLVYGYYTSTLSNANLGWEYTDSYNLGIDFSLWNRLSGTLELYVQNTRDLLVSQRLPYTSGVQNSIMINMGKTRNKGLELTLHSNNIVARSPGGLAWQTDFNLYMNRNKLLSLNSSITEDVDNGWFVGHPIDVIYDYKKLGVWQTNEAEEAARFGFQPGDIKLEDHDRNGQLSQADRYIIGAFEPDAEWGMSNRFDYKNFDLTVVTFSQLGGMLVSSLHQSQSYLNTLNGVRNNLKVDYWREDNPTNDNPRALNSGGARPYGSTLGYFDGTYLKIKTATLGYTFPKQFLRQWNAAHFRLYVACDNVATLFSTYLEKGGVDPQPTGFGAQGVGGVGSPQNDRQLTVSLGTPPARRFLFGIGITL